MGSPLSLSEIAGGRSPPNSFNNNDRTIDNPVTERQSTACYSQSQPRQQVCHWLAGFATWRACGLLPLRATEPVPPSFSRPMNNRPRGSQRSTSMGGGVQVVLDGTGSWSEMANQSSALVQNPQTEKPSGMLGFLSRKKGRDRSPKAKERGVLGKEGARVIISNT